jgi:hypothetical protein
MEQTTKAAALRAGYKRSAQVKLRPRNFIDIMLYIFINYQQPMLQNARRRRRKGTHYFFELRHFFVKKDTYFF